MNKQLSFIPEELPNTIVTYDHGYSIEEVAMIISKKKELDEGILLGKQVTLDEFKNIVVPYQRINRVEAFTLNAIKETKNKVDRRTTTRSKDTKPKKLGKAQITLKLNEIIMKMALGTITKEEEEFYNNYTTPLL